VVRHALGLIRPIAQVHATPRTDAGILRLRLVGREQLLEQHPVVNHALAKVLRRGRSPFVRERHRVCLSVVLHHQRMIDGDLGDTLIEVLHGIAAILHDGSHETVGFLERAIGVVDESRLDDPPVLGVALA